LISGGEPVRLAASALWGVIVARRPEMFVRPLTMEEGRKLQPAPLLARLDARHGLTTLLANSATRWRGCVI
jgi:hypothetical protein